jgi:RHS repeat-associated protein
MGSITAITDDTGAVEERYRYQAFGSSQVLQPDFSNRTGGSDHDWQVRFHGETRDAETGYYNYGYRYYLPELGRWPSRDPLQELGGFNLYSYVSNDSLNDVDFLGGIQWGLVIQIILTLFYGPLKDGGRITDLGKGMGGIVRAIKDRREARKAIKRNKLPKGRGGGGAPKPIIQRIPKPPRIPVRVPVTRMPVSPAGPIGVSTGLAGVFAGLVILWRDIIMLKKEREDWIKFANKTISYRAPCLNIGESCWACGCNTGFVSGLFPNEQGVHDFSKPENFIVVSENEPVVHCMNLLAEENNNMGIDNRIPDPVWNALLEKNKEYTRCGPFTNEQIVQLLFSKKE